MLYRLLRQRRRLLFFSVSVMLATAVETTGQRVPVAAGFAALVLGGIVVIGMPTMRKSLECMGLGLLGAALLPLTAMQLPIMAGVMALFIYILLYGDWSDKAPFRLALDSRSKAEVTSTPPQVWSRLVPGLGHPDDFYDGSLKDFDRDPRSRATIYLRFRETAAGRPPEATLTFVECEAPNFCRYLLEGEQDGHWEEMLTSVVLSDQGTRTRISTRVQYDALPPRRAIARWMDDSYSDELDSFAAILESRRDVSIHAHSRSQSLRSRLALNPVVRTRAI